MGVFLCLSDPGSVNLEKVSNIIIDQSLKDQMFSKEAGRICYTIVQVNALCYIVKNYQCPLGSSFVCFIKT